MANLARKTQPARPDAAARRHAEREADHAAERAAPQGVHLAPETVPRLKAGRRDQALSAGEKAWFGPRLGHDFSAVRVHADGQAAGMADALGAEAFTLGRDIYFGSGTLAPGKPAGERLLAHELAHVKQQAHSGPALQPKLKITGAPADLTRTTALLNSGLSGYRVAISGTGDVSITRNFVELPPDAQQQALADSLSTVINDPAQVTMTVSSGTPTLGGSYATGDFDIADLETYGVPGLIHEIVEQHAKQVNGTAFGTTTTGAHGAAVTAEAAVRGETRGAERFVSTSRNPDGTMNAVVEIPHTSPTGAVRTMVMTIDHNNITAVTWR